MSSHREAPAISKDPAADSTDVYAFVSPDSPETVTIIANYVPLQAPDGGPNFFEFGAKTVVGSAAPVGDDVLYQIHIDNTGTGIPSITYQFQFTTTILDPNTFLYATGPITLFALYGLQLHLEPPADLHRHENRHRPRHGEQHVDPDQSARGKRWSLRVSPLQRRHPYDAELRVTVGPGGVPAVRWSQRLRRPAGRRVLR